MPLEQKLERWLQQLWLLMSEHLAVYWPGWVAVVGFALAIAMMSHAVLNKRDPRSAAAWLGLIWLVPFVGSVLYLMMGVNRIQRRAQQLVGEDELFDIKSYTNKLATKPDSEHLLTLAELTERLTGNPLLGGNRITPMDAPRAYASMLKAIDNAEESVFMTTYIFGNDSAGKPMVEALSRAVKRGVKVRVLVDGMGSLYSFPPVVRRMRRRRVTTERFLYSLAPWRMPYMNLRNHRKIMVVDRQVGFTGGMNIRAGYISSPPQTLDMHMKVEGPVVAHLLSSFTADWYFTRREGLNAAYAGSQQVGVTLARGISAGPDADLGKRRLVLLAAIGSAQHEIRIMTPYFVPDQTLLTAIELAALRGVRVQIILPQKNNMRFVHWASMHLLPWLVNDGCEVYFVAPPFDHTKVMTVDGKWVMFGSGNWDARSLRLNFEFDVEAYDAHLAGQLNAQINYRLQGAVRLNAHTVREKNYFKRLRNGLAYVLEPYL